MDSPICGITTSVPPEDADEGAGAAAGACGAGAEGAGAAFAGVDGAEAFEPDLDGADAAGDGAAACADVPLSETTATTVLICTVSPSRTLISDSTPATGEGISASTLSVEISNSGSSFCTASPAFLSHLVMVPSKIDSPIWGITTSVGMNDFSGMRDAGACLFPAGL